MKVFRSRHQVDASLLKNPVATIGVFDGVHLGHQHLLGAVNEWADEVDGDRVVVTFDRHPLEVLGQRPPVFLTSLEHRLALLERHGATATLVLEFDRELSTWSPERFVDEVIVTALGCHRVYLGFDSSFGAGGRGTAKYLAGIPDLPVEVREGTPFTLEGSVVSSTSIRQSMLKGEIAAAARELGRPVSLWGRVMHGDGRGRQLGFPTANLNLMHAAAPPHGVYLSRVEINGTMHSSLVNIGRRPTFMRHDDPVDYSRYFNEQLDRVEVYIHGFDGDLYESDLEVELFGKLRDERRFPNRDALVEQIQADVGELESWWERDASLREPSGEIRGHDSDRK